MPIPKINNKKYCHYSKHYSQLQTLRVTPNQIPSSQIPKTKSPPHLPSVAGPVTARALIAPDYVTLSAFFRLLFGVHAIGIQFMTGVRDHAGGSTRVELVANSVFLGELGYCGGFG